MNNLVENQNFFDLTIFICDPLGVRSVMKNIHRLTTVHPLATGQLKDKKISDMLTDTHTKANDHKG